MISQKIKILIRIGSLRGGGAEKALITYLQNINPEKYSVDLLLNIRYGIHLENVPDWVNLYCVLEYQNNKPFPFNIIGKSFNVLAVKKYSKSPKKIYTKILNQLEYDIEIAFLHGLVEDIINSPCASSKKVCFIHTNMHYELNNFSKEVKEKIVHGLMQMDKLISVSQDAENSLELLDSTLKEKSKVIYNPIDIEQVLAKANQKNIEYDNNILNIVCIGRLEKEKGFDRIVNIANRLKKEKIGNFRIEIFGEGSMLPKLEEMIERFNLRNHIHLMGYNSNPYANLKSADLFVLPSYFEGFALVIAEAMIVETPIITTKVSGPVELLNNGEYGWIVENNEEDLYLAIKEVLTDKEKYLALKEKITDIKLPFELNDSIRKFGNFLDTI